MLLLFGPRNELERISELYGLRTTSRSGSPKVAEPLEAGSARANEANPRVRVRRERKRMVEVVMLAFFAVEYRRISIACGVPKSRERV